MVLNNSQYNEIMREYNAKQMNTIHELDARTAEVYMAVPQYKTLSDRISSLSVDAAKAALRGENIHKARFFQGRKFFRAF